MYQEAIHTTIRREIQELGTAYDRISKLHFTVHTLKGILASFLEEERPYRKIAVYFHKNTLNKLAPGRFDDLLLSTSEVKDCINQQQMYA
ncbi:Hpt domain-containing protein [Vibrio lentus]|nr:Hpt domain-containing protein [Vibrio lentus]